MGTEHADTAQSLNSLAVLYDRRGKYVEAEPLYVRTLMIREQQLGAEHPDAQTVRANYTSLLQAMGYKRKRGGWRRVLHLFSR